MNSGNESQNAKGEGQPKNLTMRQVFGSILASFYGVQSSKNRERDFQSGKAMHFIAAGIVMTGVWYLSIYLVVALVMQSAK